MHADTHRGVARSQSHTFLTHSANPEPHLWLDKFRQRIGGVEGGLRVGRVRVREDGGRGEEGCRVGG